MWDNSVNIDVLNSIMDKYNNDDILRGFVFASDIINVEGFFEYGESFYIEDVFDKKKYRSH